MSRAGGQTRHPCAPDWPLETLSASTFTEHEGKTTLTIRTRFESVEIRDATLKIGMTEGWTESLDRLEKHLAKAR